MDDRELKLECLKLAVSRATPNDVGKGCVETAKIYHLYVKGRAKPSKPVDKLPDK